MDLKCLLFYGQLLSFPSPSRAVTLWICKVLFSNQKKTSKGESFQNDLQVDFELNLTVKKEHSLLSLEGHSPGEDFYGEITILQISSQRVMKPEESAQLPQGLVCAGKFCQHYLGEGGLFDRCRRCGGCSPV